MADVEDCPLCLEPLPVETWRGIERSRLLCCGKNVCSACNIDLIAHGFKIVDDIIWNGARLLSDSRDQAHVAEQFALLGQMDKCPMCRTDLPQTDEETFRLVKSRVDEHDWSWANYKLGTFYKVGRGTPQNAKMAFKHFEMAATEGDVKSMHELGNCYQFGTGTEKSMDDAVVWYEKAADAGLALSQWALGDIYQRQRKYGDAARLFLQGAEQGYDKCQCSVAYCYEHGEGIEQSLPKSLYWNKQAAELGNAVAMVNYAGNLLNDCAQKNGGNVDVVGTSVVPKALYWARKSVAAGDADANMLVRQLESAVLLACGNCQRRGVQLSNCSRCKAAAYCSKDCQRVHWTKGHKIDCVDQCG